MTAHRGTVGGLALAIATIVFVPASLPGQLEPEEVSGLGYTLGDPAAPVHVVEFADFGCSACAQFAGGVMPTVLDEFIEAGRVHWKFVPFLLGGFRHASRAARAGECAGEQGKFQAMHEKLYAEQRNWQRSRRPAEFFDQYAIALGLEPTRWNECYRGDGGRSRTRDNTRAARRLGVRGTPTFFVNGSMVEGALPVQQFRQLLIGAEGNTPG